MSQTINTNTMSLNAQRNLNSATSGLATTIRGLDVAARNANDGISLTQTAEGAMTEIGNNLQRIRELSVQAANATNSQTDRNALNSEAAQLISEIDRVANQTNFNNIKLLDGSFKGALFQVGANAGEVINISGILDANTNALGRSSFAAAQTTTAAVATGTATASGSFSGMVINTITIDDIAVANGSTGADLAGSMVSAINAKMDQTGVYASLDGTNKLTLTSVIADKDFAFTAGTLTGGTGVTVASAGVAATATAASSSATFLKDLNISSTTGAQKAMSVASAALDALNTARANMGGIQNRFASTIANIQSSSENLTASRSRIRDADYAKETAELTRNQILQQAGSAMLAQANSSTSSVLQLLRG